MHADLADIDGIPRAEKWTAEEYDKICDAIESGHDCEELHGVRERCSFNFLEAFHCIGGLPFDCMHDWLEKQAACDAQSVILALVKQGKFSLEKYNHLLSSLKFQSYESADRPLPIKANSDKICGKALCVCLHLRIMPLLVSQLMGEDSRNDLLDLLLLMHQLNEIIMSDRLAPGDITEFESLLVDFFEKRQTCSEQCPGAFKKLTPKAHFLEHYPQQMIRYGPLIGVWTARFEGKHRDFVSFSETSKNFINLVRTLSVKSQKRMASRCYSGLFSSPDIQFLSKTSSSPGCELPPHLFTAGRMFVLDMFMGSKILIVTSIFLDTGTVLFRMAYI
jgi:hypothetical protein